MYSRFASVANTINKSPKVTKTIFLGSHRLFCFINISKFDSFKNPFAMITTLSELHSTHTRSMLFVNERSNLYVLWQQDKLLKTMEINVACPNIYEGYIHQFQLVLTMETIPITTRIIKSCAMKKSILSDFEVKSSET